MRINDNFEKLPESYHFSTVSRKIREYKESHPDADIIRMDIGDVTLPIPPVSIEAMHKAVDDQTYKITGVSMGNPHAVIFVDEITDRLVLGEGPKLEVADIFPKKTNVEFAKVLGPGEIEMRVWERGTGETFACGTGACATAVAAVLNGLTDRSVDLRLRGGTLHIEWDEKTNHVMMTGPATFVCDGKFYL